MHGLRWRAFAGLTQLEVAVALLLFLPAGTVRFWQAWVYWGVFTVSVVLISVYFLKRDPGLVERRLRAGPAAERERSQKVIQALAGILWCLLFVVPGLEHRFRPAPLPPALVLAGDGLAAAGFAIVFLVFRENSYAAGSIEVEPGQQVVSTGPYALVRHPMYAGAALMLLATPPALGSLWGLACAIPLCGLIAVRAVEEERTLGRSLPGYEAYRRKVRHRLIPGIW